MATNPPNRRKQLIVNRPMQGRMILNMAVLPSLALVGIAVSTGLYCNNLMQEAIALDSELPNMMPLFWLVIGFELVAAVFLLVNSLKISHTVAGPAYRICKSLERIRNGDLAFTVQLRKGDHLTEVRDQLNLLLDWLNANPPANCVTRQMAAERAANAPAATPAHPTDAGAAPRDVPAAAAPRDGHA